MIIEQATKLARAMLTRYGMSDEFDMVALETVNNQYLGGDTSMACSAQTQCEIDRKVVEAGQDPARKGHPHPDREPRKAGRAGTVPVPEKRPSPARSSWISSTAMMPKINQKIPENKNF